MKDLLIFAVDPGWTPAYALGRGSQLLVYGRLRKIEGKDYDLLTEKVQRVLLNIHARWGASNIAVVEGQFIKLFNKKPVPGKKLEKAISGGVIDLARCAQVWAQEARHVGVGRVIDSLLPSTWQVGLGCGARSVSETLKIASLFQAELTIARWKSAEHWLPEGARKTALTEDEADAVCIWAYQWGQTKLKALVGTQESLFPLKRGRASTRRTA